MDGVEGGLPVAHGDCDSQTISASASGWVFSNALISHSGTIFFGASVYVPIPRQRLDSGTAYTLPVLCNHCSESKSSCILRASSSFSAGLPPSVRHGDASPLSITQLYSFRLSPLA